MIGKSIDSKDTYYGEMRVEEIKSGLKVTRVINDKTVIGNAAIEQTGEKTNVLRIKKTIIFMYFIPVSYFQKKLKL